MHIPLRCVPLLSLCLTRVLADFLGPSYPAPSDLSSNESLVTASWRNITSTLEKYLSDGNQNTTPATVFGIQNVTFSIGMFSLHDSAATRLQFHYTSPEIKKSLNGTQKVDEDSIYRIASVTKVFTVLAGLLNLRSTDWDRALTEVVPGLSKFSQAASTKGDAIYTVQWDKVTLSALAAQIAGVPRDGYPWDVGEVYLEAKAWGLPPLNTTLPPCFTSPEYAQNCPATPYVEGVEPFPPTFPPWAGPAYANNGFILLGLAMSNITGKSFDQLCRESIFGPLGMTSSSSSTPPEADWRRSVITDEGFAVDAGIAVSSGGIFSTTRDLARFGVGILNSTLLPPDQTRKWMKPVSHTARLQYSVGRPWEILRYTHPSGTVTDIYTKLGDSGTSSSYLVLLPDYGAGFSILSASSDPGRLIHVVAIADLVANAIIPALDAQAAAEAERKFGGVYSSTSQGLNSTFTLSVDRSHGAAPGLTISPWFSNGTDVLAQLAGEIGPPPYRLLPSNSDPKARKVAFQLVGSVDAPISAAPPGLFLQSVAGDWNYAGLVTYDGTPLSLFVFDTAPDGRAVAGSPAAFGITLKREAA
ncbi:beta-lactamase/transpeptidase-like protein [Diplogelasinospora grovesii]|uniref:Beta-lactamase/transpeptidase-like protein n=1 Tax=Diplogelasinospora grovesii TaxID=303347 RepID=A0AAN6NEN3_9PEZI|nr:beta-lactamase/transpeptidase-like protein [Diplogelasinospora grovesii]